VAPNLTLYALPAHSSPFSLAQLLTLESNKPKFVQQKDFSFEPLPYHPAPIEQPYLETRSGYRRTVEQLVLLPYPALYAASAACQGAVPAIKNQIAARRPALGGDPFQKK